MAFTNTKGRYASFGVVTSLPPELIDVFWEILDNNLKDVFTLDTLLTFQLVNNQGQLSFKYYDKYSKTVIVSDLQPNLTLSIQKSFKLLIIMVEKLLFSLMNWT